MDQGPISGVVLWSWGPIDVTQTVVTTWVIMALLGVSAWLLTRRLAMRPKGIQTAVEGVVCALEEAIREVAPEQARHMLPFVGTLWVFLVTANLSGLIPGVSSPTSDLSTTSALALLVFASVHWFGIRARGLRVYLRHYVAPSPILLPFHLISEVTRTVALAVRLFGNIMSLQLAALLVLLVAGFLVPVPILMLHVIEALVQAYIFGMLALIYIAGGLEVQQLQSDKTKETK
jgi:F-type H+-transporting ATPase subunit a